MIFVAPGQKVASTTDTSNASDKENLTIAVSKKECDDLLAQFALMQELIAKLQLVLKLINLRRKGSSKRVRQQRLPRKKTKR